MHPAVSSFYQKKDQNNKSAFADIIFLNEKSSFDELKKVAPTLPRGWFELLFLDNRDRIDFVKQFWQAKLLYNVKTHETLIKFFQRVDDIYVVLTRDINQEYFEANLVYSTINEKVFFRAKPPLTDEEISYISNRFFNFLPRDFLSFLKVHNGFAKTNDIGILDATALSEFTLFFIQEISSKGKVIKCGDESINPQSLIPFYQSNDFNFQCFYLDWYPSISIGNLFYSSRENSLSDYHNSFNDNMSFFTFFDWLIFYIEDVDV